MSIVLLQQKFLKADDYLFFEPRNIALRDAQYIRYLLLGKLVSVSVDAVAKLDDMSVALV